MAWQDPCDLRTKYEEAPGYARMNLVIPADIAWPASEEEYSDWIAKTFVGKESRLRVVVPEMKEDIRSWGLAVLHPRKGRPR